MTSSAQRHKCLMIIRFSSWWMLLYHDLLQIFTWKYWSHHFTWSKGRCVAVYMIDFKGQRRPELQETLKKYTKPSNTELLFKINQKVLIENWWRKRRTSDVILLVFTVSYRISLGKSNESCLIFGHCPMECKTTNGQ